MASAEAQHGQARGAAGSKLAALLELSQKMNSEPDLTVLLDDVARQAVTLLNADRASVFLFDRESNELWSQVALGSDEVLRLDARLGIVGHVLATGKSVNLEDAHEDPHFCRAIDEQTGYRTKSVLAASLRTFYGEGVGVLQVLNKKRGRFTEEDEQILRAIASQVGLALGTVQLLETLRVPRQQQEKVVPPEPPGKALHATSRIIGSSPQIQGVVRLIERIHHTTVSVLITGESGTGKELVARAIHDSSPRASQPFIALNCAALPDDLLESELFGIERGVATGVEKRIGRFEAANGGTLFLDEIGDLSSAAQAKVLRALQENVVEKVGSTKPISVDVRIIAATNKNLKKEIREEHFREDLYYRLNVVRIQTPPLRRIPEDIPVLATHFLAGACRETGRAPPELSAEALTSLMRYRWPGNIRQLQNEIKRLVAVVHKSVILPEDLSEEICGELPAAGPADRQSAKLHDAVAELEHSMIVGALSAHHQNQLQAAKALGLSRQGLINKMKRYGITPSESS